jgi:hypothetical protein
MTIKKMHQEFRFRFDRLNSNHKRDFLPHMIDDLLNDAQHSYIEYYYAGNSLRPPLGFETTQQRIDMLSSIVEKNQPMLLPVDVIDGRYEFDLTKCMRYKHLLRSYAKTDCGRILVNVVQHGDLTTVLSDHMRKPSKRWKRLVGTLGANNMSMGNSSLYVYTEGYLQIEGVYIEYIKEPVKVFFGGYDSLEYLNGNTSAYNTNTSPINSELPAQYHTLIVDFAVKEASRSIEDVQRLQLRDEKIVKN